MSTAVDVSILVFVNAICPPTVMVADWVRISSEPAVRAAPGCESVADRSHRATYGGDQERRGNDQATGRTASGGVFPDGGRPESPLSMAWAATCMQTGRQISAGPRTHVLESRELGSASAVHFTRAALGRRDGPPRRRSRLPASSPKSHTKKAESLKINASVTTPAQPDRDQTHPTATVPSTPPKK